MRTADLFAGAGGFTEGARMAGCTTVWAGNHWAPAVATHAANHPETKHVCQDLHQADWQSVPAHDLLLASPACQGHSPARGKDRPHHDAQRSTAWAVIGAAEAHRPAVVVVENVPAFARWLLYRPWCAALHALGYALAPMVLDAADHGVPQQRRRLFVVATRSRHPIDLSLPRRPAVSAHQVVDFSDGRWSLVRCKVAATQRRVANGRAAFGDRFVMPYYGSGSGRTGRSLARPIGTITTRARWGLVDGAHMRMLSVAENLAFMGFRANYTLPMSQCQALQMLGNAVCPPVAADLISAIRRAL